MHLIINLLTRAAAGEKIEKGSPRNTAWWLGSLALTPVLIALFMAICHWSERTAGISPLDSRTGIFLLILSFFVVMFASLTACVGIFQKSPLLLIPIAAITWTAGAWLAYHR